MHITKFCVGRVRQVQQTILNTCANLLWQRIWIVGFRRIRSSWCTTNFGHKILDRLTQDSKGKMKQAIMKPLNINSLGFSLKVRAENLVIHQTRQPFLACWWFQSLFSSLLWLTLGWYCKRKFAVDHCWHEQLYVFILDPSDVSKRRFRF